MTRVPDDLNISSGQKFTMNYLQKLGLIVEPEKTFGRYQVDIYLPELNVVVEYDGPFMHHSVKHDGDRDKALLEMGISKVYHVKDNKKGTLIELARELGAPV